jgi:hypothetical protein
MFVYVSVTANNPDIWYVLHSLEVCHVRTCFHVYKQL